MYLGDFALGTTLHSKFTTRQFSTGAPFTLAGTPAVSAYEDDSTTEITAGITLNVDFDARTGLNHLTIVATSGNGYEAGKSYALVITTGTVDSVSVVGEVVGYFTIEKGAALRPTTAGRTLDVSATGEADANITQLLGSAIATPTVAGVLEVDVTHWLGTAVATPTVAGVPEVDVTHFGGIAGTFASGRPEVNTSHAAGTAWNSGAIGAATIATGAIDADAIADNAIDAGAIAADAITAAKIANGAIDAATFAAGAIDAAAIATDAIDGDALAASALTEIKTQVTDALNVDTYAEIGQEAPAATQTIRKMLGFLYKAWRNRTTQTATQYSLYNDDATTIAQKSTTSDDGTTYDRGEVATGP